MRYASITDRLAHLGSGKWAVHIKARQMATAGVPVIELTIGEPDVMPDPALLAEASRAMHAGRTRYSNGRGEPAVVSALTEKYRKRRADVTEKNILCFPGTQTALFAVMLGLAEAGDEVIVGDPLYATYEGVIAATGATIVPVPLRPESGFHLHSSDLRKTVTPRTRAVLLNSPHNPTGAVLTSSEIADIGDVCIEHDLWIVCDEVYEELIFGKPFASPFDDSRLASRTVVVSSISKSHAAPGFRSGWAAGPVEFCDRLLPVSETMLFGVQPFIADMTAMAVSGSFDTARRMRDNYERRAKRLVQRLEGHSTLVPLMPEGGMFLLIDVSRTGLDGEKFALRLLEEKHVAVMPGASFGAQAQSFVRVSLTVSDDVIEEAASRISELGDELERSERRNSWAS